MLGELGCLYPPEPPIGRRPGFYVLQGFRINTRMHAICSLRYD
jgi:hypothetical protein